MHNTKPGAQSSVIAMQRGERVSLEKQEKYAGPDIFGEGCDTVTTSLVVPCLALPRKHFLFSRNCALSHSHLHLLAWDCAIAREEEMLVYFKKRTDFSALYRCLTFSKSLSNFLGHATC